MQIIKSAVIAVSLALSLGTFSTSAVACEDGRTCFGPLEATNITLGHIAEAIKAADTGAGTQEILMLIKEAKSSSKEINANDKVDVARGRAIGKLKKARSAFKKDKKEDGKNYLGEAEKGFQSLKGLI